MNLESLLKTRRSLCIGFLLLCAATLLAAAMLVVRTSASRPIVVVPGAQREAVLFPDSVPDSNVRAFAMLYVAYFDNYTPDTVTGISEQLRVMVAPAYWSRAAEALAQRTELSVEGRMSSQVILPAGWEVTVRRDKAIRVVVPAFRRTFIAGQPAEEGRLHYRLEIEIAPPASSNPYGLVVAGQIIEEVKDEEK